MKTLFVFSSVGSIDDKIQNQKIYDSWNLKDHDSGCVIYNKTKFDYSKYFKLVEYNVGMKYPNFIWFNNKHKLLSKYQYFAILDDDLIFTGKDVFDTTIQIMDEYDLSVCSVSNNDTNYLHNKITSHDVMRYKPNQQELWITNFCEMGAMFLRQEILETALNKYVVENFYIKDYGWDMYISNICNIYKNKIGIIKNLYFENPRKKTRNTCRAEYERDQSRIPWLVPKIEDRINI